MIASVCSSAFTHGKVDMEDSRGRYHSGNHVGKVSRYEAEAAKDASPRVRSCLANEEADLT